MRRALSDWYTGIHRAPSEAAYEEIYHRRNHFTHTGESLISEELHSRCEDDLLLSERRNALTSGYYEEIIIDGPKSDHETDDTPEGYDDVITTGQTNEGDQEEYDDVWNITEDLRNLLDRANDITLGYYDDVITDGLKPECETEDTPGSYDDVITSEQNSVDTPENYDDVIINGQDTEAITEGDQEEYDDVKNSSEDERNLLGQFLLEESHLGEAAVMAQKAAELDICSGG
ncbi:uncharacterized protein LOC127510393 isoform X1 [Ctenopharyngodon idella]|nr:uncharacterized protein LOC127510393 isoform X1 [Ctenopharyngodon idella]